MPCRPARRGGRRQWLGCGCAAETSSPSGECGPTAPGAMRLQDRGRREVLGFHAWHSTDGGCGGGRTTPERRGAVARLGRARGFRLGRRGRTHKGAKGGRKAEVQAPCGRVPGRQEPPRWKRPRGANEFPSGKQWRKPRPEAARRPRVGGAVRPLKPSHQAVFPWKLSGREVLRDGSNRAQAPCGPM
jgi:hypothetical protein